MRKAGRIQLNLIIAVLATAVLAFMLMQFALRDMPQQPEGLLAAQAKVASGISFAAFDTSWEPVLMCDVYSWSSAALDRPVRLLGRLHICSGDEQWLPGELPPPAGLPVLYRYVNSCCSGHAVPAVLELRGNTEQWSTVFPQDSWVQLNGFFQPTVEPGGMPAVRVDGLLLMESPPELPLEQMFPDSKMAGPCQGSRPQISYPPR